MNAQQGGSKLTEQEYCRNDVSKRIVNPRCEILECVRSGVVHVERPRRRVDVQEPSGGRRRADRLCL